MVRVILHPSELPYSSDGCRIARNALGWMQNRAYRPDGCRNCQNDCVMYPNIHQCDMEKSIHQSKEEVFDVDVMVESFPTKWREFAKRLLLGNEKAAVWLREMQSCAWTNDGMEWQALTDYLKTEQASCSTEKLVYLPQMRWLPLSIQKELLSILTLNKNDLQCSQLRFILDIYSNGQETADEKILHYCGLLRQCLVKKTAEKPIRRGHSQCDAGASFGPTQPTAIDIDTPAHACFTQTHHRSQNASEMLESPSKRLRWEDSLLCSQLSSQESTQHCSQHEGLDDDMQKAVAKLGEIWQTTTESETPDEIKVFLRCNPQQMQMMCDELGLKTVAETTMSSACHHFKSLCQELSHSNAQIFASNCILPKVVQLCQNSSRTMFDGVAVFAKHYSSAITSSVFIPAIHHDNFGNSQVDLIGRITKEIYSVEQKDHFHKSLLESQPAWTESLLTLVQPLIDSKTELPSGCTGLLVSQMETAVRDMSSNLKFGKLVLALINKHPKELSNQDLSTLTLVANSLTIFLKKAIVTAIKKLSK